MNSLKKLYQEIPTIKCPEGCVDCCSPVIMLRSEALAMGYYEQNKSTHPVGDDFKCNECTGTSCLKYEARPLICRLFGAVQGGPLSCTKVLTSTKDLMTVERAAEILGEYLSIVDKTSKEVNVKFTAFANEKHDAMQIKKGNLQNRSTKMIGFKDTKGKVISVNESNYIHYQVLRRTMKKLEKK